MAGAAHAINAGVGTIAAAEADARAAVRAKYAYEEAKFGGPLPPLPSGLTIAPPGQK